MPTTLAKAIGEFFEIPASQMVKEFKPLTAQDKVELTDMLRGEGFDIERPSEKPKEA
jgi:hypothetical protein